MCIICILINININNSRDSIVNGLSESASDSEGGEQDGEDGGSESEGKLDACLQNICVKKHYVILELL